MKRKIALLMATVMTMSIVPMNAFAGAVEVRGGILNVSNRTLLLSTLSNRIDNNPELLASDGSVKNKNTNTNNLGIDYVAQSNNLELEIVNRYAIAGDEFRLTLVNGEWATLKQREMFTTATTSMASEPMAALEGDISTGMMGVERVFPVLRVVNGNITDEIVGYGFANSSVMIVRLTREVTTDQKIVIPMDIVTKDLTTVGEVRENEVRVIVSNTNNNNRANIVENAEKVIARGLTTNGTVASVRETKKFRDEVEFILTIDEIRAGIITNGQFEITAPTGYSFVNREQDIKITSNFNPITGSTRIKEDNRDRRNVLVVTLTGVPTNVSAQKIELNNLRLVSDSNSPANKDIMISIRNVAEDSANITNQSNIKVGTHEEYSVTLRMKDENEELTQFISGTKDDTTRTTTIVFEENLEHAWTSNRTTTFKLPESVKVINAEITAQSRTDLELDSNLNQDSRGQVTVRDNEIVTRNITTTPGGRSKIEMELELSIEPGFSGDITMEVSGLSLNESDTQEIVIATAVTPITIDTKVTSVSVGFQTISTADITITENYAGALTHDETLEFFISDLNHSAHMSFSPNSVSEVTEGDLQIKNISTASNNFFNNNSATGIALGTALAIEVTKESKEPSTIKFSNVNAVMSNTVPNGVYDLIVAGTAVADNFGLVRGKVTGTGSSTTVGTVGEANNFDTTLLKAPYLRTGFNNASTAEVRMTAGESRYLIDGEARDMEAASYISPASNSLMVPVRFVANAFGISDSNITWNDATRTVTIRGFEGQIIQFTADSDQMDINGVKQTMKSPDGLTVTSEMTGDSNMNSRMYLPFRALGNAFGVPTTWDATTKTAIYNERV